MILFTITKANKILMFPTVLQVCQEMFWLFPAIYGHTLWDRKQISHKLAFLVKFAQNYQIQKNCSDPCKIGLKHLPKNCLKNFCHFRHNKTAKPEISFLKTWIIFGRNITRSKCFFRQISKYASPLQKRFRNVE